jgi:hypothetical protein
MHKMQDKQPNCFQAWAFRLQQKGTKKALIETNTVQQYMEPHQKLLTRSRNKTRGKSHATLFRKLQTKVPLISINSISCFHCCKSCSQHPNKTRQIKWYSRGKVNNKYNFLEQLITIQKRLKLSQSNHNASPEHLVCKINLSTYASNQKKTNKLSPQTSHTCEPNYQV